MRLSWFTVIAASLAIVGALNWGSIGLFNLNLVRSLFGPSRAIERSVYTIVGIAGLFLAFTLALRGGKPYYER